MKILKLIGIISLFCFTFIYTDKIIDVTINQDEIMEKIKENEQSKNIDPINATIIDDQIIPGSIGKYIDIEASYKNMKKINSYDESLLIYKNIYPEISIYNNYDKYIINGNTKEKKVSLLYILNNNNTIDNIISIINKKNIKINFFIDSSYLNNNIQIIDKIKENEIYSYGVNGKYTKDNLIIANNIINNKSNNNANLCLFLEKDNQSLKNCKENKMLSIIPNITGYTNLKQKLQNGLIILIDNTKELESIIDYINSKGYYITPLSEIIKE